MNFKVYKPGLHALLYSTDHFFCLLFWVQSHKENILKSVHSIIVPQVIVKVPSLAGGNITHGAAINNQEVLHWWHVAQQALYGISEDVIFCWSSEGRANVLHYCVLRGETFNSKHHTMNDCPLFTGITLHGGVEVCTVANSALGQGFPDWSVHVRLMHVGVHSGYFGFPSQSKNINVRGFRINHRSEYLWLFSSFVSVISRAYPKSLPVAGGKGFI